MGGGRGRVGKNGRREGRVRKVRDGDFRRGKDVRVDGRCCGKLVGR